MKVGKAIPIKRVCFFVSLFLGEIASCLAMTFRSRGPDNPVGMAHIVTTDFNPWGIAPSLDGINSILTI